MGSIEEALIEQHLRTLKMPGIRQNYQSLARQATAEGWTYEVYLKELLETELGDRDTHMISRRLKEAQFPEMKTLEQIEWDAMQGIFRTQIAELATTGFLDQAQDVIIADPIGTGNYVKYSVM